MEENNKKETSERESYQITNINKTGSKTKKLGLIGIAVVILLIVIKAIKGNENLSWEEILPAVIATIGGGLYAVDFFSNDEKDDSKSNKK